VGVAKGSDFRTEVLPPWIERRSDGVILTLRVQPGARRTAIVGAYGDRLKVAIATPPTDGRANTALLAFIAERLAVPKSAVRLLSGPASRDKRIEVDTTLSVDAVAAALAPRAGQ
jgi:uncharacterized protein (TIGR00251 family)